MAGEVRDRLTVLPVIVLTHFACSIEQFSHPQLRRFNLVGLDLLDHGWTEGEVPETYTQENAAADVAAFLVSLDLRPCLLPVSSVTVCQARSTPRSPGRMAV